MLLNFIKLGGLQLSGVEISWVGIFQGRNFPGGNCPGWGLSWVGIVQVVVNLGGNFLWQEFSGLALSGGNHPVGNFPRGSFHVADKDPT